MPVVSWAQSKEYLTAAGFLGADLNTANAIAGAESKYNTTAVGGPNKDGTYDYGLMQINSIHNPTAAQKTDGAANALMAYQIYQAAGNKFTPWSTYNSGAYHAYENSTSGGKVGINPPTPATPNVGGSFSLPTLPDIPGAISGAASGFVHAIQNFSSTVAGIVIGIVFLILGIVILARNPIGKAVKTGAKVAVL